MPLNSPADSTLQWDTGRGLICLFHLLFELNNSISFIASDVSTHVLVGSQMEIFLTDCLAPKQERNPSPNFIPVRLRRSTRSYLYIIYSGSNTVGGDTSTYSSFFYPPFASRAKGEVFGLLYVCLFVCLFVNDFSTTRGPIHAIFCMRA